MEWDVTRYADKLPKKLLPRGVKAGKEKEASLKQRFVPLDGVVASTPCIIIDAQGIIMAWYLPKILSDSRQVGLLPSNRIERPNASQNAMLMARQKLRPLLDASIRTRSWRDNPNYFHPGEESLRGSVDFSPAWFQQGRDVSTLVRTLQYLAAYSASENVAEIPAGFCELPIGGRINLASCHL